MKDSLFYAGCFRHLFSKLSKKQKSHQGYHVKSGGVVLLQCLGNSDLTQLGRNIHEVM